MEFSVRDRLLTVSMNQCVECADRLADRLVRASRATMGDTLRSVTYFTPDGHEQVYLREDLAADADVARFVDHESNGFDSHDAFRTSELGDYNFTVHGFEDGYVTRVTTREEGVFVTADSLTIHRSEEVATALGELLER